MPIKQVKYLDAIVQQCKDSVNICLLTEAGIRPYVLEVLCLTGKSGCMWWWSLCPPVIPWVDHQPVTGYDQGMPLPPDLDLGLRVCLNNSSGLTLGSSKVHLEV